MNKKHVKKIKNQAYNYLIKQKEYTDIFNAFALHYIDPNSLSDEELEDAYYIAILAWNAFAFPLSLRDSYIEEQMIENKFSIIEKFNFQRMYQLRKEKYQDYFFTIRDFNLEFFDDHYDFRCDILFPEDVAKVTARMDVLGNSISILKEELRLNKDEQDEISQK